MTEYITDSIQINLCSSSAYKLNGSKNSNLHFSTPAILKPDKHIFYSTISIVSAQIPISYYLVNSVNNQLVINSVIYTLINGNYTTDTFIIMTTSILPVGYGMSFNSSNGIFTLTNSTIDFTINTQSTCYKLFGFFNGVSLGSISKSLIFPNHINMYGITRIKIKSNSFSTKNIDTNSGVNWNILGTIGIGSGLTGMLMYNNYTNFRNIMTNNSLDNIDIQITDENDNLLDFNGIDICITLQLDVIKELIHDKVDLKSIISSRTNDLAILSQRNKFID